MYNSPHHPEFTHHYGKLIEMAAARRMSVSLICSKWGCWGVEMGESPNTYRASAGSLGLALEAAIEHLAGVPICK